MQHKVIIRDFHSGITFKIFLMWVKVILVLPWVHPTLKRLTVFSAALWKMPPKPYLFKKPYSFLFSCLGNHTMFQKEKSFLSSSPLIISVKKKTQFTFNGFVRCGDGRGCISFPLICRRSILNPYGVICTELVHVIASIFFFFHLEILCCAWKKKKKKKEEQNLANVDLDYFILLYFSNASVSCLLKMSQFCVFALNIVI